MHPEMLRAPRKGRNMRISSTAIEIRRLPKVRLDGNHLPGSRRRASSVFIWAGARLLGKERGHFEAGLSNSRMAVGLAA